MNILITGAAGFIGSHLLMELRSQGHNVVGIDNLSHPCTNEVSTEYADVRYYKDILAFFIDCDIVFHLAAQISVDKSISNPQETLDTNVTGTLNILEAARKFGCKVIFASTSEVYGSAQFTDMAEDHPLDPQSPYGASKLAAERLCYSYYRTYGTRVVMVRNFNTFGPYQNDDSYGGVIAKFTKAAIQNKSLKIFGDGTQVRDYMWIEDALDAYKICMDKEELVGQTINFGSGKTVSVNDIAKKIIEETKSDSVVEHIVPRSGEIMRLCADIRAASYYGFEPKVSFDEGLGEYILFVRSKFVEVTYSR